ncbi:zinc finger BED domain-containing protein RICESLEEPER 2-like protein [Tanacetum coccineum]
MEEYQEAWVILINNNHGRSVHVKGSCGYTRKPKASSLYLLICNFEAEVNKSVPGQDEQLGFKIAIIREKGITKPDQVQDNGYAEVDSEKDNNKDTKITVFISQPLIESYEKAGNYVDEPLNSMLMTLLFPTSSTLRFFHLPTSASIGVGLAVTRGANLIMTMLLDVGLLKTHSRFDLSRIDEQGCLNNAVTCSRGVWILLQLAAGVFGYYCNLHQGCLDTAATYSRGCLDIVASCGVLAGFFNWKMNNGDADPMNIDDESDDSVEEIGKPTQLEGVASTSRPKKRKRKLISKVWDYFVLIEQDPEKPDQPLVCKCKKCNKLYSAESYSGTGNLKRHLKGCLKSTTRDIGQYMISSSRGVIGARNSNFNQGKFRELLVHAVVRHDLPFSFTEYEGVKDVFKYLEPDVTHITRNTTKADMLKMHGVESKRLRDELLSCPNRICLTSDAWTSIKEAQTEKVQTETEGGNQERDRDRVLPEKESKTEDGRPKTADRKDRRPKEKDIESKDRRFT